MSMREMLQQRVRRRQLQRAVTLATLGAAGLTLVPPVEADVSEAVIRGSVFEDVDGNGTRSAGERGIAGVAVSDGKATVIADANGRYELAVETERRVTDVVFVSVPSGYAAPPDEAMTPTFYRSFGELGNGDERTADFGLRRSPISANPNFSFINLADVHVQAGTTNNRERFTGQLAQVNASPGDAAFIQVSGDLTNRATDAEFLDYKAATATSKLPVWPAVGNHEYAPGTDYRTRIDNYRRHLGPEWYSFDHGGRHFVVLENNSAGFGDPAQLDWLRADLARHATRRREVVVLVHKPLNTPQTPSGAKPFIDLLGEYETVLVLMGHTHVNDVALETIPGARHVVTNSSSYTIDQTPNGFRRVRFRGGEESHPFHMYGVRRSLTAVHPAPGARVERGPVTVQANAYDTEAPVARVHYRIDGGDWEELDRSSAFTRVAEWDAGDVALGQHELELRATDVDGRTWSKSSTFTIVAAGSLPTAEPGADWPMFHGDPRHSGRATDSVDTPLGLAWSYRTPGSILTSSPAVVDGVAYVGTRDENGRADNGINAVDVRTGRRRWHVPTDAEVQASPAVHDGVVLAATVRGTLLAVDAGSGKELWRKEVGASDDGVRRGWMYYSPTVTDGVVYQAYSTAAGGAIMALDVRTGAERWNRPLAGSWISESSPAVDGDRVYVGGDGGWLIALDAETGAEQWRKRPAGGWMHSMPAAADGRVYMGYGGRLLVALDGATGTEVWRYQSPGTSYIAGETTGSSPAVVDGTVYMGFPDGEVTALDAVSGARRWSHHTDGGVISSAAISGSTVFIGSNDGRLYGLARDTGEPRWSYEIGAWVASSPAISGNTIMVGAFDGNLYGFVAGR